MSHGRAGSAPVLRDPVLAAVLANRLDGIVREMTNTLLRSARSALINTGRDFSCAITTGDNRLLAVAEGLPVHTFGSHLQTAAMTRLHPDLARGDAFLHNDPYLGNTHPADQTVLVPVFIDGRHRFTACAKAHQADIGNSIPSTYHFSARDVYEEGSVIFPCVRVQRSYELIDDVVRLGMRRIRVPEQWRGDLLAAIGAARTAERRLEELCARYGPDVIDTFIEDWLNYSEARMAQAIRALPRATLHARGAHDPVQPFLPAGIPLHVTVHIDPDAARITVDLRDNIDCVDAGLNESEACAINNVTTGIFNCLDPSIPRNSGSFRRIDVLLRENCVAGIPRFPRSCSIATTNVGDRLVNLVQRAFAELGDGYGLAEGGVSLGAGAAVVSGRDPRRDGQPYVNQLLLGGNGGPGGPQCDGWLTYGIPVVAGLTYGDSVELDEVRFPLLFETVRLLPGTAGAGRYRGAPAMETSYRSRGGQTTVVIISDGQHTAPRGVLGGHDGCLAATHLVFRDGSERKLANFEIVSVDDQSILRGRTNAGGGYGDPRTRDPQAVLHDVLEGWETTERARDVYGVCLVGRIEDDSLAVDALATAVLRSGRATGVSDLVIRPLDERAYALLAEEGLGPDLFNPTQHIACELVEAYATELALDLCRQLDLQELLATPRTVADVRAARGWSQEITPALHWLLDRLAQIGHLAHATDGYRLVAPLPPSQREAIRARGLTTDASYAPAYELLDEAAAVFPAVARGETTGERALLGKVTLWIRYFDNRNAYYALNNRVTAPAAAARLAQGAHVLEVGAGLGSATEALLEALAGRGAVGRIASYRVTEPVAFFRRRAQRTLAGLHADVPFGFAPLDLNQPWATQGVDLASQHLVWGVNVFHLARDLDAVLREAHATLAPGGWLVVGEGMRPFADCVVGAEFPFRLLASFTDVGLDPATRPTPGFLTAEHWLAALERAGFDDVTVVPNVIRLRAHYPGMLAAAACGRRR